MVVNSQRRLSTGQATRIYFNLINFVRKSNRIHYQNLYFIRNLFHMEFIGFYSLYCFSVRRKSPDSWRGRIASLSSARERRSWSAVVGYDDQINRLSYSSPLEGFRNWDMNRFVVASSLSFSASLSLGRRCAFFHLVDTRRGGLDTAEKWL